MRRGGRWQLPGRRGSSTFPPSTIQEFTVPAANGSVISWSAVYRNATHLLIVEPSHNLLTLIPDETDPLGVTVATDGVYVYWTCVTSGKIRRALVGGTNKIDLVTGETTPTGVACNHTHLFWCADGKVRRCLLDGSGVETIVDYGGDALELSADDTYLYAAYTSAGIIYRCEHDGTNLTALISGETTPTGVAINATHIFWVSNTTGKIRRALLDGSGAEDWITGETAPYRVCLTATHIYWTATAAGLVRRSLLDGTGVATFISGESAPSGMSTYGLYLYWTDTAANLIRRATIVDSVTTPLPDDPAWFTAVGSGEYTTASSGAVTLSMFAKGPGGVGIASTASTKVLPSVIQWLRPNADPATVMTVKHGWPETRPAGDVNGNWYRATMDSTGQICVAGADYVYRTANGGTSWDAIAGIPSGTYASMAGSDDGQTFLTGSYGGRLWSSSNGGTAVTEERPAGDAARNWHSAGMTADGSVWFAGYDPGRLYRKSGGVWAEVRPAGDTAQKWISSKCSADGTYVVAVCSGGRAYRSVNGGTSWSEIRPDGDVNKTYYDCAVSDDGQKILLAEQVGGIWVSLDGGTTWTHPAAMATSFGVGCEIAASLMIVAINAGDIRASWDDGVTWFKQKVIEDGTGRAWLLLATSADGAHWVAGVTGGRLYMSDGATVRVARIADQAPVSAPKTVVYSPLSDDYTVQPNWDAVNSVVTNTADTYRVLQLDSTDAIGTEFLERLDVKASMTLIKRRKILSDPTTNGSYDYWFDGSDPGVNESQHIFGHAHPYPFFRRVDVDGEIDAAHMYHHVEALDYAYHVAVFRYNGTTEKGDLWIDGVQVSLKDYVTGLDVATPAPLVVDPATWYFARVCARKSEWSEMAVCAAALTDAQIVAASATFGDGT